jgi:hypothetical protein
MKKTEIIKAILLLVVVPCVVVYVVQSSTRVVRPVAATKPLARTSAVTLGIITNSGLESSNYTTWGTNVLLLTNGCAMMLSNMVVIDIGGGGITNIIGGGRPPLPPPLPLIPGPGYNNGPPTRMKAYRVLYQDANGNLTPDRPNGPIERVFWMQPFEEGSPMMELKDTPVIENGAT